MPRRLIGKFSASAEQTATGAGITLAHGLYPRVPRRAWIETTQSDPTAADATSTALITALDNTNVTMTIDASSAIKRYIVHAEV